MKTSQLGICKLNNYDDSSADTFPFSENEKKEFLAIKNGKRKKEYLAVRHLLLEMTNKKNEILYDTAGKPRLKKNDLQISISHSPDLAVVFLSKEKAGVDVENIQRRIQQVTKHFICEKEWNDINKTVNPQLTRILYWCAKEAAFKFSPSPEIDFKKHIAIFPFDPEPEGGTFFGELSKENPAIVLTFHYFFYENNVIVYCVEEVKNKKK